MYLASFYCQEFTALSRAAFPTLLRASPHQVIAVTASAATVADFHLVREHISIKKKQYTFLKCFFWVFLLVRVMSSVPALFSPWVSAKGCCTSLAGFCPMLTHKTK